jgi:uncharacterized protein YtpQ (UPF0354 family)
MSFFKKLFGSNEKQIAPQQSGPATFESGKSRIFPRIRSTTPQPSPPGQIVVRVNNPDMQPLSKPLFGDLVVQYAVDNGSAFSTLFKKHLPENTSIDELHAIACANLERVADVNVQQTTFGPYGLLAGGNHEAAMFCVPEFWKSFSDNLNHNLVVALPSKDLVFIASQNDAVNITKIKEMVADVFSGGGDLISRNLFLYDRTSSQWSVYETVS